MASITDPAHAKTLKTSDGTTYAYIYHAPLSPSLPTLLLLHGFPSATYDWRRLIPLLAATGVGILAPDLLGYGGTDKPSDPALYRMKRISGHVAELLDHEGAQNVIGIGHDWGCGLLSRMANYEAARFTAFVFISVAYLTPSALDIGIVNQMTKQLLGYETFGYWEVFGADDGAARIEADYDSFESALYAASKQDVIDHVARAGGLDEWLKAKGKCATYDWLSKEELATHRSILLGGGYTGPLNWYKQSMRGLGAEDDKGIPEDKWKLKVPTLFVLGENDVICVPDMQLKTSDGWVEDLTVKRIESSHWIPVEKPDELAAAINDFVKTFTKT